MKHIHSEVSEVKKSHTPKFVINIKGHFIEERNLLLLTSGLPVKCLTMPYHNLID